MKRTNDRLRQFNLEFDRESVLPFSIFLFAASLIAIVLGGYLPGDKSGVLAGLGVELIGGAYFLMIAAALDRSAERRSVQQEKERLVLQMGSPYKGFATEAARALKARGWGFEGEDDTTLQRAELPEARLQRAPLNDVNLKGANLHQAKLQKAHLERANLEGADLYYAKLQGAILRGANLQDAKMHTANLEEATLLGAKLQGAHLDRANLQGAYLEKANLQGAKLFAANLKRAHLEWANLKGVILHVEILGELYEAEFDETTILPNGSNWTPNTDMARFTDPSHPDFWSSDILPARVYPDDEES